jgi:hypothetical protein
MPQLSLIIFETLHLINDSLDYMVCQFLMSNSFIFKIIKL